MLKCNLQAGPEVVECFRLVQVRDKRLAGVKLIVAQLSYEILLSSDTLSSICVLVYQAVSFLPIFV
jgi:hypothetical protein